MDLFSEMIPVTDTLALPAGFQPENDIDEKVRAAVETVKRYLSEGWALFQAWSGGKDSSVQLVLTLQALREHIAEHGLEGCPELIVMHSDTLVENPVIHAHTQSEITHIREYAQQHQLPVTVEVAEPRLSENYLVSVIGHQMLASVAGVKRTCAIMMKVEPLQRLQRQILQKLQRNYGDKVLTLVGKRYDESDARRTDMITNGERPDRHVIRDGQAILSSIAHLTLDDVLWVVGMVRSDKLPGYSDFNSLVETYRAANGGECMVNAVDGKGGGAGCGARYGCWLCLQNSDDKSMESLLADPGYGYLRPLWHFRNYLQHCHNDPARRTWLSRRVNTDGSVNLAPASYSPEFTEELLTMLLSIQVQEADAAAELDIAPRFSVITLEEVIAIDALWSRYGYHKPLQALAIWQAVVRRGLKVIPPEDLAHLPHYPSLAGSQTTALPFQDAHYRSAAFGLRQPVMQVLDQEPTAVQPENTRLRAFLKTGKLLPPVIHKKHERQHCATNTAPWFQVNTDELGVFMAWELPDALAHYNHDDIAPSEGLRYLLRMGVISLNAGGHSDYDRMMRQSDQIYRYNLRPILNQPEAILRRLGSNMVLQSQDDLFSAA
ncbi:MAG: phosphoadenosine phosphosulfate reductase family protein [Marinobacterium sp.]|nr:phosphoadenosine phosphosulfate reductase family protein [Marinobacterium sp.]